MAQPLLIRSSLAVAFVTVLQYILPGLAIASLLVFLARFFEQSFTPFLGGLGAVTWLLSALAFRPAAGTSPELRFNPFQVVTSVFGRWFALAVALMAIGYLSGLAPNFPRRVILPWIVLSPVLAAGILLLLQLAMRKIAMAQENRRRTVVVGVTPSSISLASKLVQHPEYCSEVLGFFEDRGLDRLESMGTFRLIGKLGTLADFVRSQKVDVIFIALPIRHVERVMNLLDELRDSTASIYYVPDVFVFDLIQSRTTEIDGIPVVAMCETPFYGYRGVVKRVWDLGLTLAILLPGLPLMLLIGLFVLLTSRGPVIFRQRRYGLDGEEIVVYKFRTMRVTEDGGQIAQATRDDPRITLVGKFLRRLSLDELPQLFNVLQGRMSLVGPRPHAVAHNELYRGLIKGYMVRHKVQPGITGWAQVNGCRGETNELSQMEARVTYDLEYLRNWSPSLDLKILLMTATQLLVDKKAY
jgi:putative colanic acid biosysnthesis UDP-glucose lipid carrier transferase